MALRPCLDCGALSQGSRCPGHTQVVQRVRYRVQDARRPSSAQRGYDRDHQRQRQAIAEGLARGDTVGCWRCGQGITEGMAWDLGHDDTDRSIVRGAEHSACNRATMRIGRATATVKREQR